MGEAVPESVLEPRTLGTPGGTLRTLEPWNPNVRMIVPPRPDILRPLSHHGLSVAALQAIITLGSGTTDGRRLFPSHQVEIEPELDAACTCLSKRKEDVAGYIDMWSSAAQRPSPAMLKFIFNTVRMPRLLEGEHSPRDPYG